jgi:cellulose synthase/poly-beta-1,6-N-acetylglucosamine synthase-like glycosyltransferase
MALGAVDTLRHQATWPLGTSLVQRGLIDEEQLRWALAVQQRTGSRLGSILIASGLVRRLDVYHVLSEMWQCPFVDLTTEPIDLNLVVAMDPRRLTSELWMPIRRLGDGSMIVATAEPPTSERATALANALQAPVRLVVTTDWDIRKCVSRLFADQILDEAVLGLWQRDESHSARKVLNNAQRVVVIGFLVVIAEGFLLAPVGTAVVISGTVGLGFLVSVFFKFAICMFGSRYEYAESVTHDEVAALRDDELPLYTILVPAYREANVVGALIANLSKLDYPPEKVEILLLLEADDDETRQAAMAARPPDNVTIVTVPPGQPQTKPKACNVGLFLARGEFLVIYDAEDRPETEQLKAALVAFRRADEKQVCVQAALNYFNAEENALTRMFTLEYSFWFDYMLPGLEALELPIPLGGTSNHFRTEALRRLGGWDPFNVTEDADLGIRSAALGETVGVISSTTFEEANSEYPSFVRQRSRWIKGYLQTTLVHLRSPIELVRRTGWTKALGFALLVGGTPLSFLCVPPLYLLFAITMIIGPKQIAPYFPGWVLWVSIACLIVGNAMMIYVSMMGVFKRKRYGLVLWALLNPLYWLLHSLAAYKALWQLIVKPHYWEKTEHGLTSDVAGSSDIS